MRVESRSGETARSSKVKIEAQCADVWYPTEVLHSSEIEELDFALHQYRALSGIGSITFHLLLNETKEGSLLIIPASHVLVNPKKVQSVDEALYTD